MIPNDTQMRTVNRAMKTLCKQLDRFETICAENVSPLKSVIYVNKPSTEFSEFRVVYRGARAVRK